MIKKFLSLIFVISAALLLAEYYFTMEGHLLTRKVVMTGTLVLLSISLLTFFIAYNTSLKPNPNQFVRGVMGSTFLKFMLCAMAAGIYIYFERKNFHKPDLFFMMFLYVLYTTVETIFLSSMAKSNVKK